MSRYCLYGEDGIDEEDWQRDMAKPIPVFDVKCDVCKIRMRQTLDIRESYAGGTCEKCRRKTGWNEKLSVCANCNLPLILHGKTCEE